MRALGLTPILNVSDMAESLSWFASLGWDTLWEWGTPSGFAAVGTRGLEIFLCLDCQGGRARREGARDTGAAGGNVAASGTWLSVWVDDVDAVHRACIEAQIDVTHPPTDEPWGVREMHVRHPDGHVLRVSQAERDSAAVKEEPPLAVERVDRTVRLERRLAAVLAELADHKGLTISEALEEMILHTFEPVGGGVASPHTPETFDLIDEAKQRHGLDYDVHASYRFVESEA